MMMISSTQCYKLQTIWSAEYEKLSTSIIKNSPFTGKEKKRKEKKKEEKERITLRTTCCRKINPDDVFCSHFPPTRRAFTLSSNGSLDACLAENVTTLGRHFFN